MTLVAATVTLQDVLSLPRFLSEEDRQWLATLLNRLEETPLPEVATMDEAIAFYLADLCSLGRAAELAGVTRWDIIDKLQERNIPSLCMAIRLLKRWTPLLNNLNVKVFGDCCQ